MRSTIHIEIHLLAIMIGKLNCNLILTTHTPHVHRGLTNITNETYCLIFSDSNGT